MRIISTLSRGVALAGALTLVPVQTAFAAGSTTGENTPLHLGQTTASHATSSGSSSGILRTIIALVIVVAVIYAVARILRAVKGRERRASGDGLKHLATLPLGGGRSLALVRSGRDIVLVGVGEHGVTPIKTYTEEEAIANGIHVPSEEGDGSGSDTEERPFGDVLDRLRKMTARP